jgi:ABC-type lipoprotein export system ATPase subunit
LNVYRILSMNLDDAKRMENEAIVATGLTKWFGEGDITKTAVNRVTLVAHFGGMLFIVGPSGNGKTTMLSKAHPADAFMRPDQVEAAWQLLMPVLQAWRATVAARHRDHLPAVYESDDLVF